MGLKSQDPQWHRQFLATFDLKIDNVVIIYVIGTFFPTTNIVGLSVHSKSSILDVVFIFGG
jgi:hypothetical protein